MSACFVDNVGSYLNFFNVSGHNVQIAGLVVVLIGFNIAALFSKHYSCSSIIIIINQMNTK